MGCTSLVNWKAWEHPAPPPPAVGEVYIWIFTHFVAAAQTLTNLVGAGFLELQPFQILALPPAPALPLLATKVLPLPQLRAIPRAQWSRGLWPSLSSYGCGYSQLLDPAEATGEGVQQRPGVSLQAPFQPQQRRALLVREARPRGIQQSALLQRPQEASEAETRSVEAGTVGSPEADTPLPFCRTPGSTHGRELGVPLPLGPPFLNFQTSLFQSPSVS